MPGLTEQDLTILRSYAEEGNRELYWNYLAQKQGNDGYGVLALGVVRNDSMPGAVANHFAANRAQADGRAMSERDWERFGEDLVSRDVAFRSRYLAGGREDLALNLPVKDVQSARTMVLSARPGSIRTHGPRANSWMLHAATAASRQRSRCGPTCSTAAAWA